jgi:lipopolysaccharide/colanic/teichoic acid biosynthesis glycosyltransferase
MDQILNSETRTEREVKSVAIETTALVVNRHPRTAKDLGDFLAGLLLFVIAIPFIVLSIVAVKLTSRGPGIYRQTRLGRDGVPFTIFKIRTMRTDAEKDGKPQWAVKGDSRITRMGRFLRATHLDELPQLWNVLRREMSLVGPRPERPEIVEKLREEIPDYDTRLAVKPGITGYAQIHLEPDETIECVKQKLQYDQHYIARIGIIFDAWILFCTALKCVGLRRLYQRKPTVH